MPDFGGGGGNGTLPPQIDLPAVTGRVVRFLDSAGTIKLFSSMNPAALPDGFPRVGGAAISWGVWGGLTGPVTERYAMVSGLFLTDDERPAVAPPPYDCGNLQGQFIVPEIGQIFCPGDGYTPGGDPQIIIVPDEATRLFLGEVDRNASTAPPGTFGDNSGAHEIILDIAP